MSARSGRQQDGEPQERPQRTRNGGDRNKRMFASLQSALGGSGASPLPGSTRERRDRRREEPAVERLDDLDSIISQISDLSVRPDRSAQQIKRNISASSYLGKMDEDEWEKLCDSLMTTALDKNETDFVVGLFIDFMKHEEFCDAMCFKLMNVCSSYIMEGGDTDVIPCFLGAVLCYNWPRNLSKAIDTVNPILYTTLSIVKGWLIVLTEDNVDATDSLSEVEEEERPEREKPEIVNRCAEAVTALCDSMQRSLWMKCPELCDEIYAAIKPAITHNSNISGDVKAGLLQTMIALHAWTKSKAVTTRSSSTQTV